MVDSIKISGTNFITQKTGNIKDFYKITSCIGRGMYIIDVHQTFVNISCVLGAYGEVRKC